MQVWLRLAIALSPAVSPKRSFRRRPLRRVSVAYGPPNPATFRAMLIRRSGELTWREPATQGFVDERALQQLLETSPEVLPGAAGSPLLVADEVQLPVGPIDLVGIALDGTIFLIECKLRANPEIRRQVIGQILAYASSAHQMPFDTFRRTFEARTKRDLVDSMRALAETHSVDFDSDRFIDELRNNLVAGRFHLVVAVDEITDELKHTIEYLNTHTDDDLPILALELRFLRDGQLEILVPAVYGEEAVRRKESARRAWDETSFLEALEEHVSEPVRGRLMRVFAHARDHDSPTEMYWGNQRFYWGSGKYPSASAWFQIGGKGTSIWTIYPDPKRTVFVFNFDWIRRNVPMTVLDQVAAMMHPLAGTAEAYAELAAKGYRMRPGLPVATLFSDESASDTVIKCVELMLGAGPTTREPGGLAWPDEDTPGALG
jgi:hypothetical protein